MRNIICSSYLHSRLSRGFALGCFCLSIFFLSSSAKAYAAGIEEVEEMENLEEMEDIENEPVDDSNTGLDGIDSNNDSSEAGPDNEEGELASPTVQNGCTCCETLISFLNAETVLDEEVIVYEDLAEFEASSALVDRYQYELLKRLEFLQYSQVILLGLIFVLIFKKK